MIKNNLKRAENALYSGSNRAAHNINNLNYKIMFIKLTERTGSIFYINTSHIVKIYSQELNGEFFVLLRLSTGKVVAIKENLDTILNLINSPKLTNQ